jgi:hypothetical protein
MAKKEDFGDEIARVAYNLYEKRGKLPGYAQQDWLQAEKIVMEKHSKKVEKEPRTAASPKAKKTSTGKQVEKQTSEKPAKRASRKTR